MRGDVAMTKLVRAAFLKVQNSENNTHAVYTKVN
jgi:hypothetical protein